MTKAKLSDEVKTFIVKALTCFDSPLSLLQPPDWPQKESALRGEPARSSLRIRHRRSIASITADGREGRAPRKNCPCPRLNGAGGKEFEDSYRRDPGAAKIVPMPLRWPKAKQRPRKFEVPGIFRLGGFETAVPALSATSTAFKESSDAQEHDHQQPSRRLRHSAGQSLLAMAVHSKSSRTIGIPSKTAPLLRLGSAPITSVSGAKAEKKSAPSTGDGYEAKTAREVLAMASATDVPFMTFKAGYGLASVAVGFLCTRNKFSEFGK
ncbi:MAG: hypothetical protein AAAC48_21855 [Phyllobacterium sp.]|uniref:hypothetical protein n=1 Tax=Phyllobacterium sp. TaxID=1871046 RepID=UPI0030F324BE